jgi:Putative adhesin
MTAMTGLGVRNRDPGGGQLLEARITGMWNVASVAAALALGVAAMAATGEEANFERDLSVSGRAELMVTTGSGRIHLTSGENGRIHILGHVRSNWASNDDKVREIAAHPPVEQTGNIVRVGLRHENLHNISIDYQIEAPANAFLDAATGSGSVIDEGVGADAKLNTGSGGIHATGLEGSFTAETGSGSIYAEQTGAGDVKAETGSGSIELRNLHGSLRAHTGSGSIKVEGAPSGPWRLDTGSGGIELWTGGAGFTLDASTGSGHIRCDREIVGQFGSDKHHLTGNVGGGGPMLQLQTGSGSIEIH